MFQPAMLVYQIFFVNFCDTDPLEQREEMEQTKSILGPEKKSKIETAAPGKNDEKISQMEYLDPLLFPWKNPWIPGEGHSKWNSCPATICCTRGLR